MGGKGEGCQVEQGREGPAREGERAGLEEPTRAWGAGGKPDCVNGDHPFGRILLVRTPRVRFPASCRSWHWGLAG